METLLPDKYAKELPFIREVLYDPTDFTPRLIYADWLEEQQDIRAELLRIDVQLQQIPREDPTFDTLAAERTTLLSQVDRVWLDCLAMAPIERCPATSSSLNPPPTNDGEVEFEYRCPKRWENLKPIDEKQHVRFCHECERTVHYCHDIQAARKQAQLGNCVALDPSVPRKLHDLDFMEELDQHLMLGVMIDPEDHGR